MLDIMSLKVLVQCYHFSLNLFLPSTCIVLPLPLTVHLSDPYNLSWFFYRLYFPCVFEEERQVAQIVVMFGITSKIDALVQGALVGSIPLTCKEIKKSLQSMTICNYTMTTCETGDTDSPITSDLLLQGSITLMFVPNLYYILIKF